MRPGPSPGRELWRPTTGSTTCLPSAATVEEPSAATEHAAALSEPGVAVMDPAANGRMADPPLPVDPLRVSEDEPAAAERTTHDEEATEANGQPSGAFRFVRALVPWPAAPNAQHVKDSEARRS